MPEDRFDNLLNEMRNEPISADEISAAKARVWEKIGSIAPAICTELRADLALYAAGNLEGSRRLLVEDHLSRCPACRRTLAESQGARPKPVLVMKRRSLPVWSRWAMAAGVAAAALFLGRGEIDRALAPSGSAATIAKAQGGLYRLPGEILTQGAALSDGQVLRTGLGARAVLRLRDGSVVEVNERSEFSLQSAWSGQTIHLERGDVVVQAAKQRRGRLQVITSDTTASVKGTIFAVSAGLAGSVVSVVEGSVQVRQPEGVKVLTRGQQAASTRALRGVPARRALAWSENASTYFELLGELDKIQAAIAASGIPAPRTQPKLLPYLPDGAVTYFAIPNPGPFVEQAATLIQQRSQDSAALREWWNSAGSQHLRELFERIKLLSPMVGDEIVFTLTRDPAAMAFAPLVLAEVQPGQQAALKEALAQVMTGGQGSANVSEKLLVISDSPENVASLLSRLGHGAASPFAAEVAAHYQGGLNMFFAFDATAMPQKTGAPASAVTVLGADKLKYVTFEQRSSGGSDEVNASLKFSGPRTGIASWLATPGPAGSAEYVSSTAILAVSASTRDPRQAFDEFVTLVGKLNPKFPQELADMEAKTGVRLSDGVVAALGTDFTIAIERPTIPVPGWVAILEVNQPVVLEAAVRKLAEAVNAQLATTGQAPRLVIETQQAGDRTWTVLKNTNINLSLSWTYDAGYLVMSTDQTLAAAAIATRNGGAKLIASERFKAQLPSAQTPHQSGFFWFNAEGPIANIASVFGGGALKSLLESREPILVVVNAETERIQASSRTRLMSMLMTMMMVGGPQRAGQAGDGTNSASN